MSVPAGFVVFMYLFVHTFILYVVFVIGFLIGMDNDINLYKSICTTLQGLKQSNQKGENIDILCYARGCEFNNIDCTCMYDKRECQVNCSNCVNNCKKDTGDRACEKFVRK